MSARPALPEEVDKNQARASDPAASAWVSANAGTGKTEVLVKRVLRLLLAGFRPESILCLTYTKTAAAEMQNRLLDDLAGWATMSPQALRDELAALLRRAPEQDDLRNARRLFAHALEARGGLKIHTIHGFCERLLQRFPLEAQVTPHFAVLDERGQALLRKAAFDFVIAHATEDKHGALGQALGTVIAMASAYSFRKAIDAVLGKRAEMEHMTAYHGGRTDWAEAECVELKRLLDVVEADERTLIAEMAGVLSDAAIDSAVAALVAFDSDKKIDKEAEVRLRYARESGGETRATALELVFLTGDGEPRAQVCTKKFANAEPMVAAMLDRAQGAFAHLNDKLAHLRVAEASGAVLLLADAIMSDYERRKRAEAALDFDDLIVKTLNLLSCAGAAAWVLYKIDGGIDHILVDEAQDTNPAQWSIVERLAEEFLAGSGASDRPRTLFAVGDEKQSIYSFQGADPARFGEVGRAFQRRAEAAGLGFHQVPLNLSFRSTVPVLEAVDAVFAKPVAASGLVFAETSVIKHHAFRQGEAGLVELWAPLAEEKVEPAEPFEPWKDTASGARSVDELCRRIAAQIKGWITGGEKLLSEGRNVKAGDILILVRRRDPFTTPMIRALKREGVPVAGADRMKLMDQLAVQDLVALADVLLMPENDLALAIVLKSPLFGLNDDDLFNLAYDRAPRSLWSVLKEKAGSDARFAEAHQCLSALLSHADLLPPYEFFAELLGAEGQMMRERMLVRLGPEAAEAIDEFLDLALAYDREAAPSLQGFIDQLRGGDVEIKRDMEQGRDEVRIMTVHGAKGLQAPIVILPDTCMNVRPQWPRLFPLPRAGEPPGEVDHIVWPPAGYSKLAALEDSKAAADDAERREYHRLLYVAMTRARDRLYVCGWQGPRDAETGCWYDLVKEGLGGRLIEVVSPEGTPVRRMESRQEKPAPRPDAETEWRPPVLLPAWALTPAKLERSRPKLAPSRLALGLEGREQRAEGEQPPLGARALSQSGRYARGRLVHALLQYLPEVSPEAREAAARAFVAARGADLPAAMHGEVVAETLAILNEPSFTALFGPSSLAEVPIVAQIGEGEEARELTGQIDRLAVLDDTLLVLDYKTNRPPPRTPTEVAPAYIAQLAAYRIALQRLFPGRTLRAALLWTDGPQLMEIPSPLLDAAERRIVQGGGSLDVAGVAT
jgi:ATP-dependent helicase/nuclease subunit A